MKARHTVFFGLALVLAGCGNLDGPGLLGGPGYPDAFGDRAPAPYAPGEVQNPSETDLSVFDEENGGEATRDDSEDDALTEDDQKYAWVKVTWQSAQGDAAVNLDLHVVNASGEEIFFLNTGDTDRGRFAPHEECISFDCAGDEANPREAVVWDIEKLVPGHYQAWVENASENSGSFEIDISAAGHKVNESASVGPGQKSQVWEWDVEGPSESDPNAPCLEQLEQLGVDYDPITISEGACTVEDAVMVNGPVNGVTYRVTYARSTTRFRTACKTALALHKLGNVLQAQGIDEVYHNGSYNCRNVAGTGTPSQHSYGLAFDFNGFGGGGKEYSVVKHWEHNTDSPSTEEGQVLYDIAHGAYDAGIFNVILTPNYNADHDDHFHMDLGSGHTIRSYTDGEQTPTSFLDEYGYCGQ